MSSARFFLTVSMLLCFPIFSANAESLRYEKVFSQISIPDNRLIFSVESNGYAVLHAPAFTSIAGQYEWHLSNADLDALWASIKPASIPYLDMETLNERLAHRGTEELVSVSGTDITYLQWQTGSQKNINRVQVSGLHGWRLVLPEYEELERLAAVESRIWLVIKKLVNEGGGL